MAKNEIIKFYKKWIEAEKKSEELTKSLLALEKEAKKFVNADISATSSMFDGVAIVWEEYNIWGQALFYNPTDFLNACKIGGDYETITKQNQ